MIKPTKKKEKLEPLPGKIIWNEEAITRYKNNMQSVEVKQKLQNFINHDYKDCSTAAEKLTSVLHDTALASVKFVKSLVPKRLNFSKKKPCFSESCHDLKNAVKKYCFLLNKYPDNGCYWKAFYSFRSK